MGRTTDKIAQFFRLACDQLTAHATTDYTLSAGFGSTASVALTNCNDHRGRVVVTSAGSGQAINPTCTIAYKDGAFDVAPHVMVCRGGGSQATIIMSVTAEFTTGCILTFNGTAAAAETYTFNYWVAA